MSRRAAIAAIAFAAAGAAAGAAHAQASLSLAEERANATFYGGGLALNKGFTNRYFGGVFANQYVDGLGIHLDVNDVAREQNAAFAALGISWQVAPGIRPKVMLGSSTNNSDIAPETYASAQVQIRPTSDTRTIITPSVTYERFRNGGSETTPGVDAVYYFSIPSDMNGYYVLQAGANVGFNNTHSDSWTVGGGLQTVRANGLSFGAYADGGHMVYNAILGVPGEQTDFYSIRPSIGFRFTPEYEVFVRGEYTHTGFYDATGGILGFKITF